MDELEASGLLKEEEEEGGSTAPSGQPSGPSADAPDGIDGATEASAGTTEASREAGINSSVKTERPAVKAAAAEDTVYEGVGEAPAEEEPTVTGTAGEEASGPAEQRVLGLLEGLTDWSEVQIRSSFRVGITRVLRIPV